MMNWNNNNRNNSKNNQPHFNRSSSRPNSRNNTRRKYAQKNYLEYKDQSFVMPYNFVHSDFKHSKLLSLNQEERSHTGVIHCQARTVTPLIVPDTANAETGADGHKIYPALRIQGNLVIPASSLRGAIRNMYEALTDSCYVTAKDTDPLNARDNTKSRKEPGLLKKESNGNLKLYPATKFSLPVKSGRSDYYVNFNRGEVVQKDNPQHCWHTGDEVDFLEQKGLIQKICNVQDNESGLQKGYVIIGEDFGNKRNIGIFKVDGNASPVKISSQILEQAWKNYMAVLDLYENEKLNSQLGKNGRTEWYVGLKKISQNFYDGNGKQYFPVYYKLNGDCVEISPGQISRSVFMHTEADLLKKKRPCTSRDALCPACRLFGMIGKEEDRNGAGSRIRLTDGIFAPETEVESDVTLHELGTPRLSYMLSYADYSEYQGQQRRNRLTYDSKGIGFNGRKFYWHHDPSRKNKDIVNEKTKRNGTFECIRKGSEFSFDIYYDGISEQQRNDILWCLTFNENSLFGTRCYHLGHGKPLGFGTVKLTAVSAEERTLSDGWNFRKIEGEELHKLIAASQFETLADSAGMNRIKEVLEIVSRSHEFKNIIRYPYIVHPDGTEEKDASNNEFAGHQWYSQNLIANRTLPNITETVDEKQYLHPYMSNKQSNEHNSEAESFSNKNHDRSNKSGNRNRNDEFDRKKKSGHWNN